jgi:hypothetical protein
MLRRPLLLFFARRERANAPTAITQVPEGTQRAFGIGQSFCSLATLSRSDRVRFLSKEDRNAG